MYEAVTGDKNKTVYFAPAGSLLISYCIIIGLPK